MANQSRKNLQKKLSKKSKSSNKNYRKLILDKEFSNLKSILPTVHNKPNVDQVTILNETVKMIANLEKQVLNKLAQENKKRVIFKPISKNFFQEMMLIENSSQKEKEIKQ